MNIHRYKRQLKILVPALMRHNPKLFHFQTKEDLWISRCNICVDAFSKCSYSNNLCRMNTIIFYGKLLIFSDYRVCFLNTKVAAVCLKRAMGHSKRAYTRFCLDFKFHYKSINKQDESRFRMLFMEIWKVLGWINFCLWFNNFHPLCHYRYLKSIGLY